MCPHDIVSNNVEHVVDRNVPKAGGTQMDRVCMEGVRDGFQQRLCR